MALSKIDAVNFLTGTIPSGNIATSSLSAAATGKVLQVVSTTKTDTFSESISARGVGGNVTGLAATITPTSASSKLLVFASINTARSGDSASPGFTFYRDGSAILVGDSAGSRLSATVGHFSVSGSTFQANSSMSGQVDASSTSSTTFNIRLNNSGSSLTRTFYINRTEDDTDANDQTRNVSSITVMEVSA